jgi:hypothetical protein
MPTPKPEVISGCINVVYESINPASRVRNDDRSGLTACIRKSHAGFSAVQKVRRDERLRRSVILHVEVCC